MSGRADLIVPLLGLEESTRNMLDLSAVPNVKGLSHLPIIVDPSHATGRPDLIQVLLTVRAGVMLIRRAGSPWRFGR